MKHVSLSEARANIASLLDEVERGETVTISREGHGPDAVPDQASRERVREAIEGILELRKHTKPVSVEEIIAWKNEGRE